MVGKDTFRVYRKSVSLAPDGRGNHCNDYSYYSRYIGKMDITTVVIIVI